MARRLLQSTKHLGTLALLALTGCTDGVPIYTPPYDWLANSAVQDDRERAASLHPTNLAQMSEGR